MNTSHIEADSTDTEMTPEFVERQRQRLEALREEILQQSERSENEKRDIGQRHANEVQDVGDEGAIEARRDNADALIAEREWRLREIRRALEKVADGSYGFSDSSAEPIGRARLEAVPEARFTVEEEARRVR